MTKDKATKLALAFRLIKEATGYEVVQDGDEFMLPAPGLGDHYKQIRVASAAWTAAQVDRLDTRAKGGAS